MSLIDLRAITQIFPCNVRPKRDIGLSQFRLVASISFWRISCRDARLLRGRRRRLPDFQGYSVVRMRVVSKYFYYLFSYFTRLSFLSSINSFIVVSCSVLVNQISTSKLKKVQIIGKKIKSSELIVIRHQ